MTVDDDDLHFLSEVDSTNNYAMRLIDADKARHGTLVVAKKQTEGKGQRGKIWTDDGSGSLLMSLVIEPKREIGDQFAFSAGVAVSVAETLQSLLNDQSVWIKWPNDMIICDKKAGGILIENVLRGSVWTHAVVGIGINVGQERMDELPFATSLRMVMSGDEIPDVTNLALRMRAAVLTMSDHKYQAYQNLLHKKDDHFLYKKDGSIHSGILRGVHQNGMLVVEEENSEITYRHGEIEWIWD